jgi:hypothetical protein
MAHIRKPFRDINRLRNPTQKAILPSARQELLILLVLFLFFSQKSSLAIGITAMAASISTKEALNKLEYRA